MDLRTRFLLGFWFPLLCACDPELKPHVGKTLPPTSFDLTILHLNDHHSHLLEGKFDLKADNIPACLSNVTQKIQIYYGGFPRLVTLIKQLERKSKEYDYNVLKLHAGDAISGSMYYTLFKGKADAELMSKICFDALTLGNHEFDDGDAQLAAFIEAVNSFCAKTSVVSANLVPRDASPLEEKFSKSVTKVMNGEKVGIIGIGIKDKTEQGSSPDPGTFLLEERSAAQAEIDRLIADGVNKIILLTHVGYDRDVRLWSKLKGVDIVVGGDSHTLLGSGHIFPAKPRGPYALLTTNADGEPLCIVQAWEYAHGVGELHARFDSKGVIRSCSGSTKFPIDGLRFFDPNTARNLNSFESTAVREHLESTGNYIPVLEDTSTTGALQSYSAQVDELKKTPIATVPETICASRIPGGGGYETCPEISLPQGGPVCNLVAQAYLEKVQTADIVIMNAGNCRSDILAGSFTYKDVLEVLPFKGSLVTLKMNGAQIKEVLEAGLEHAFSTATGAYPYASGIRFDVDSSKSQGFRASRIQINSRLGGVWEEMSESTIYTVATISFLANGKDGYTPFLKVNASKTDTYLNTVESFHDYVKVLGTIRRPAAQLLSTQAYIDETGMSLGTGNRNADVIRTPLSSFGWRKEVQFSAAAWIPFLLCYLLEAEPFAKWSL